VNQLTQDQIDGYLNRIGLSGPLPVTAETLAAIQSAHLHTVPFENLDISVLDRHLALDIPELYEKVVTNRRGGFCFELNGLLATLLEGMGFEVWRMAAQFTSDPNADPFDHLILMVGVPAEDSRWYVDAGAGRVNPERPVPIGAETDDGQHRTRFTGGRWVGETKADDVWAPVLSWGTDAYQLADFLPRCLHFQTDPESFFRSGALCTILVPDGRVTLAKRTLIRTIAGLREERELTSDDEIAAVLATTFGIRILVDVRWR
jgi:N-hydroxyarylamine O-acetyltransferase